MLFKNFSIFRGIGKVHMGDTTCVPVCPPFRIGKGMLGATKWISAPGGPGPLPKSLSSIFLAIRFKISYFFAYSRLWGKKHEDVFYPALGVPLSTRGNSVPIVRFKMNWDTSCRSFRAGLRIFSTFEYLYIFPTVHGCILYG